MDGYVMYDCDIPSGGTTYSLTLATVVN